MPIISVTLLSAPCVFAPLRLTTYQPINLPKQFLLALRTLVYNPTETAEPHARYVGLAEWGHGLLEILLEFNLRYFLIVKVDDHACASGLADAKVSAGLIFVIKDTLGTWVYYHLRDVLLAEEGSKGAPLHLIKHIGFCRARLGYNQRIVGHIHFLHAAAVELHEYGIAGYLAVSAP